MELGDFIMRQTLRSVLTFLLFKYRAAYSFIQANSPFFFEEKVLQKQQQLSGMGLSCISHCNRRPLPLFFDELLEFRSPEAAGFFAPGNICLFVPFRLSVCLEKKTPTAYFPSETLHGEETFICRDDTVSTEQEMRDSSTCLHNHNWHSN